MLIDTRMISSTHAVNCALASASVSGSRFPPRLLRLPDESHEVFDLLRCSLEHPGEVLELLERQRRQRPRLERALDGRLVHLPGDVISVLHWRRHRPPPPAP